MRSLIWVACCAFFAFTSALPTIDDYRVKGLEKYGATDELYSGFMPISWEDNKDGSLFFWLAKNRHMKKNEDEKLVVWLNGGPGCSSMIGMMHEHGPFTIETDLDYLSSNHTKDSVPIGLKYKLKNNPYSWNEVANILYVEQPIRTGFSVAAKDKALIAGEDQVAVDFRRFLISFMQVFTEYKGVELFIAGESYAGFYVPSIASHILQSQLMSTVHGKTTTTVRDKSDGLNLSGVAIGNGVMDMLHQEPSYAEYAYTHGLIPLGAKLKFEKDWENCLEKLKTSKQPLTRGSFDDCNMMGMVLEAAGLPNEYNTATFIQYNEIIGPGSIFDDFFQDPNIQSILHVRGYHLPGINFVPEDADIIAAAAAEEGVTHKGGYYQPAHNWGACSDVVDDAFAADHPISVVPQLQFLSQGTSYTATGHLPGSLDTDTTHIDRRNLRTTTIATTSSANSNSDSSTTTTTTATAPTTTTTPTTLTSALTALTDAEHSIRVLLYSGEFDLNCNTLGTLHTLEANTWRNKPWSMAERSLWKSGTDTAGEYFTMDGIFSFLIVRNSGHLLPKDLPGTALDLIDRFIHSRSFADVPLPSEQSYIDAAYPKNIPGIYPHPTTTTTTLYSSTTIVVGSVFLLLALSAAVWWYSTREGVSGYLTSKSPNSHNTHAYTKLTQLVVVEDHIPTTPTLDTAMTSTATSAANSRKYGTHEL